VIEKASLRKITMKTGRPTKIKWTAEQDQMIKDLYQELGPKELAKRMSVDVKLLKNRAYRFNVQSKVEFAWTMELEQIIHDRYPTEGPSLLAKELGLTIGQVISKSRRMKVGSTRKLPPKGFEWTEDKKQILRERYVDEGVEVLAKEWNLSQDNVRKVASNLGLHTNWGHKRWGVERAKNNRTSNIHYFDTWTPNMAYILGFLFADGSIDERKCKVTINLAAKDTAVLEFIKKELKFKGEIKVRKSWVDKKGRRRGPGASLTVCSMVMAKSLERLGMHPRKTYNDDPYPEIPDEMFPHFARGNLDGDGSISICKTNGACSIAFTGPLPFIEGLKAQMIRLTDVADRTISEKVGKGATISGIHWGSLRDLTILNDFLFPPGGYDFCLERKRNKLKEWLKIPSGSKCHYYSKKAEILPLEEEIRSWSFD
jgi:hypothetical protein